MRSAWQGARVLLHADVDAFFASVELRDQPQLRGAPVAVCSEVICAATYEARAFGVRGGMRVRDAVALCPQLIKVPIRPDVYEQASRELFALFREVAPEVEAGSMEEAFLDVSADHDPVATAQQLRSEARHRLGLPVSVGVGRTRLLAKIGSRRAKPDGLYVITDEQEQGIRDRLTIKELWGVGPRTRSRLSRQGIETVADLQGMREGDLNAFLGTTMGRRLFAIALGRDDDQLHQPPPRRSVSAERTIWPVSCSIEFLGETFAQLAASAAQRLQQAERLGTAVTSSVTLVDGREISHTVRLDPADQASDLLAGALLVLEPADHGIRSQGVIQASINITDLQPVTARDQPALPL